jgi:hypothetical protein
MAHYETPQIKHIQPQQFWDADSMSIAYGFEPKQVFDALNRLMLEPAMSFSRGKQRDCFYTHDQCRRVQTFLLDEREKAEKALAKSA